VIRSDHLIRRETDGQMHQRPGPAVENSAAVGNTPEQRQRIQMVLLRESGMTQPLIAAATGVSLSTVNRAHMAYDQSSSAWI
jgi:Homeodomain-like domain